MTIYWIKFEATDIGTDATNCTPEQLPDAIRNLQADGYTIVDVIRGDECGADECGAVV